MQLWVFGLRLGTMFSRLLRLIRPETPDVHFHSGNHGRPYVCENPRCESPALTTPTSR